MSHPAFVSPLQYYLLSPTNPPPEFVELHNRAFHSWMGITKDAFREVGNGDLSHLHDDFIRQHVLACLCSGEEIVATFLHSFASIETDATRTFRYMSESFPELFFQKIKKRGIKNVMTSNYLAVSPEWRRAKHEIEIGPVMVGLALRVRDLFQADAFIGVWRSDRKVHQWSYDQGGECIIANVASHKTPCDLILMDSSTPYRYPSKSVEERVNELWNTRIEGFHGTNHLSKRREAA